MTIIYHCHDTGGNSNHTTVKEMIIDHRCHCLMIKDRNELAILEYLIMVRYSYMTPCALSINRA